MIIDIEQKSRAAQRGRCISPTGRARIPDDRIRFNHGHFHCLLIHLKLIRPHPPPPRLLQCRNSQRAQIVADACKSYLLGGMTAPSSIEKNILCLFGTEHCWKVLYIYIDYQLYRNRTACNYTLPAVRIS